MANVFISYSHKDEVWKDRVMNHLGVLENENILKLWNDRDIGIGADWFPGIEKELNTACVVIMLITANFLTSQFILRTEVPQILQRRKNQGILVVPVIVKPCAWQAVQWLSAMQLFPKDGIPLSTLKKPKADAELANLALVIQKIPPPPPGHLSGDHISLYKLPVTGDRLFGREKELKILDDAWADCQTDILTLVAWGGVGKTALVNQWLNRMKTDNYRGAQKVYGWSFYSQGAKSCRDVARNVSTTTTASADEFFQETLQWFGDAHPEAGSAVDKGRRLARLARQQKTLLILDGIEPLQYPPGEITGLEGKLKDNGLAAFLKELAGGSGGNKVLCVITTREPVTDLLNRKGYGVTEIPLERLSEAAGVKLLNNLGATIGSQKDFHEAVTEYGGHALALTLLGHYIKSVHGGDIRRRDEIPQLTKERLRGRHAMRVMEGYVKWFGPSPELNILYLLGLFDRPVEAGAIEALKKKPVIPGVTDRLQHVSAEDWQWALSHLREAGLVAGAKSPIGPIETSGSIDCHPLVREYFGEKLRQENPAGWKKAHERLYRYFKDLPKKELPDTLAEMEPLFAAVAHGCKAGLHQEAFVEVWWNRTKRGHQHYSTNKLGAFGSDLTALSHFFDVPWNQPAAILRDKDKAIILNWAAFDLRALGRLREASQPMKTGLEIQTEQMDWKNAAIAASNLSELLLMMGDVPGAVDAAHRSVTHADRSGDVYHMESKRTTLADALHQAGELKEAEQWFREAEAMKKKRQPRFPFLYSLQGYKFCDLLLENLASNKTREVRERAEKAIKIAKQARQLLAIGLDKLTLGRVWMMWASDQPSRISRAMTYLEQAVEELLKAGQQQYLVPGLLARAECYRHMNNYVNALDDLSEARDIAELGNMKLHLCDYHLEAGRLCHAQGKMEEATEHVRAAKAIVEETGYFRRKKELMDNC